MNETIIKLTQFYLAIVGLDLANADCKIYPQVHNKDFIRLEQRLNDLFFSLDSEDQVSIAFDFYQSSILIKSYANLERTMTKEQFIALVSILFE